MPNKRFYAVAGVLLALLLFLVPLAMATSSSGSSNLALDNDTPPHILDDGTSAPKASHRLIVELVSPPLTVWSSQSGQGRQADGRLDINSPEAQGYLAQLEAEQAAFVRDMQRILPSATVATYLNESGTSIEATYQGVFNGVAVDPGSADTRQAQRILSGLSGVKAVHLDYAHQKQLYESVPLINAPVLWDMLGGQSEAGRGIKVASVDGGIHHDAPMFDGTGFDYPADYPPGGLGDTANNNGKIIVSRAYFRPWDLPAPGDEATWPGENGTSHGVHTSGIAAGNPVTAEYLGYTTDISGVAPAAWVMSYRVFYYSVNADESFYNIEGIAALEDVLEDGADVVNNSWGGGPGSMGGSADPLDTALINLVNAGTFVSMSAGNSGPTASTTDHPSDEYMIVAASTTSGTLAAGRLRVSAPEPVPDDLINIAYSVASFGPGLDLGQMFDYEYMASEIVDPANGTGCAAWGAGTFEGKAALIRRGDCPFSDKVYNAQQAGAEFVVLYNNAGDGLISPSCASHCDEITISTIFIGQSNGEAMRDWYADHPDEAALEVDTTAFQAGNVADRIITFSSRGPSTRGSLKPDIAAPGVNILSQGYAPGTTGEDRHLGYGQVSGTSMAAPHVAGAAALLKQVHPEWTNAQIKSAMMTSAKYMDMYNDDGSPAQPLDMGAGRLDLEYAADPGVFLSPASVSFGYVPTGTTDMMTVTLTSAADETETYHLSTLYTGDGFTNTSELDGFDLSTHEITLAPGESAELVVTFDALASGGMGDHQGYIVMDGESYDAHMAVWARVTHAENLADILIIDNDGSISLGLADYSSYYTSAVEELGYSYDYMDVDSMVGSPDIEGFLDIVDLLAYDAVIYFTGDNYQPDGTFTVPTPLTEADLYALNAYAQAGGHIIATGQDLSAVVGNEEFFYNFNLGATYLQDSITGGAAITDSLLVSSTVSLPMHGISVDLTSGAQVATIPLTGDQEVPPVSSDNSGEAALWYDEGSNTLHYEVTVTVASPMTVTASHIHTGTMGTTGPVLVGLYQGPTYVTDSLTFEGDVTVSDEVAAIMMDGGHYINVHSSQYPSGELRGQIDGLEPTGDGAGNQYYVDEISPVYNEAEPNPLNAFDYIPTLEVIVGGTDLIEEGYVGMAHREQPALEAPTRAYMGRAMYFSFGLEGVNNDTGHSSRAEVLERALRWGWDNPVASIEAMPADDQSYVTLVAGFESNLPDVVAYNYRWDFGDGSDYEGPYSSNTITHQYDSCTSETTARVEITDSLGNHSVASISGFCEATAVGFGGLSADSGNPVSILGLMALFALGIGALALWRRRTA